MKPALPFFMICGALIAAVAVLGAWGRPPDATAPFPDLTLRDPEGARFDVVRMKGKVWVASFLDAACVEACPATLERLTRLRDGLPDEIPLVTFITGSDSLWPSPLEAADQRSRWILCQGNAVDADDEQAVRRAAVEFFRVPDAALEGLSAHRPAAWIAVVDAQGRPLPAYAMPEDASADLAVAAAWGDVEFRTTLVRSPGRQARLFALTTMLLVVGVVLARLERVKLHPLFTGGATVVTTILLGFAFRYVELAISSPSRGSGWERPLYFAILATHTALGALLLVLALTLVYHAVRRQLERHRSLARWVAPAWIAVTVTGAVVYFLIGVWFPAV